MLNVKQMTIAEPVSVDPDRMVELCVELGEMGAETLIMQAMDDLSDSMSAVEAAYLAESWNRMRSELIGLEDLSTHVGMSTMARVARDVRDCLRAEDSVSLMSTMCRLRRITDKSTCAVWEMRDIPV